MPDFILSHYPRGIGYSVVTAVSGGLLLELSLYLDFGLLDSIHRR